MAKNIIPKNKISTKIKTRCDFCSRTNLTFGTSLQGVDTTQCVFELHHRI